MYSPGLELNWLTGLCHHNAELLCSIEGKVFHDQPNDCCLYMDSAFLSWWCLSVWAISCMYPQYSNSTQIAGPLSGSIMGLHELLMDSDKTW